MQNNVSFNPVLTDLAVEFMHDQTELVGRRLCPIFNTPRVNGIYPKWESENALNIPTTLERAPSAPWSRTKAVVGEDTFFCRTRGHEETVDDDERDLYSFAFDADAAAMGRVANVLMINHELRVHTLATSSAVPTSTPSTKWDASSPTIFADVDVAREAIHDGIGVDANLMVIGRDVFNVLKNNSDVLDRIKYVQRGVTTEDILASLFGVNSLIVAGIVRNTAQEGQAIAAAKIWGEDVVLAHINGSQDLKAPTFMRTFSWTDRSGPDGVMVESYREDKISSDTHRAKQATEEKIVSAAAGYYISNTLS